MVIRHGRPMEAMQADPEGKWGKLPANRGWQGSAASEGEARIAVRGSGAVLQKHRNQAAEKAAGEIQIIFR